MPTYGHQSDFATVAKNQRIMDEYRRKLLAKGVFDGGSKYVQLMSKKRMSLPRSYCS